MRRLLLIALLWLLPAGLHAACAGEDLLPTLTGDERARLDAARAATPFADGNHWRATRGDTVVHLVGTIHAGDPRLDAPVARMAEIVRGADLLLLESTGDANAAVTRAMAENPRQLLLDGPTLPERLSGAEWQALSDALRARGMPPFMAARMHPWFLGVMLAVPPCVAGLTQNGVDAQLEAAAQAAGVPTASLENPEDIFSSFASVPFETQMDMVRMSLMTPDAAEDLFETLMRRYLAEDTAAAMPLSAILAERAGPIVPRNGEDALAAIDSMLLEDRNRAWITVIVDAAEAADGPVVAAFGAAHMAGSTGVPALLEAEGFTLERLPF